MLTWGIAPPLFLLPGNSGLHKISTLQSQGDVTLTLLYSLPFDSCTTSCYISLLIIICLLVTNKTIELFWLKDDTWLQTEYIRMILCISLCRLLRSRREAKWNMSRTRKLAWLGEVYGWHALCERVRQSCWDQTSWFYVMLYIGKIRHLVSFSMSCMYQYSFQYKDVFSHPGLWIFWHLVWQVRPQSLHFWIRMRLVVVMWMLLIYYGGIIFWITWMLLIGVFRYVSRWFVRNASWKSHQV
jgi:hypothetical protein